MMELRQRSATRVMTLPRSSVETPPNPGMVTDGRVRIGPLLALPALMRELGQDPDAVLREAGLDPQILDDPDNVVEFLDVGRLLSLCATRAACPHIGLLLGRRSGIGALGLIGLLGAYAPDVGTALRELVRYASLNDKAALPFLAVEGERAFLGYSVYVPGVEGLRHIYDGVMAVFYNIMKALCGPAWRPIEVHFSHTQPADPRPFRSFFKVTVRFDAERTGLVFRASWLAAPLRGADPQLLRVLEERLTALESEGAQDLAFKVRRVLHSLLLEGRSSRGEVADALGIHIRTLNRRMRERGWTLKRLIEDERYAIACKLLEETEQPVTQVAAALGYGDATAFARAFRRWSGTSPTAWRAVRRGA